MVHSPMAFAEASLAICSNTSAFSPNREASYKHHGKEFRQHRCECDSTIVAGVCPFTSLVDRVYVPSAQALRRFNQQKMRESNGGSSSIACA